MQTRRSKSGQSVVDIFECQSCHTVIREKKSGSARQPGAGSGGPQES